MKRAIKIGGACMVAIVLAWAFQLQFYTTAGIIAILSIGNSKKETLKTACNRGLAFLCALLLAAVFYHCFGFGLVAFGCYIVCFAFICLRPSKPEAIAMDSVLISHFLTAGEMSASLLGNELLLFLLGTGCGIVANMLLRKDDNQFALLAEKVDVQIKEILHKMSVRLTSHDSTGYDGACFLSLDEKIAKAQQCALANFNNTLTKTSSYQMDYIAMRQKQRMVLEEMYKTIVQILEMEQLENTTPLCKVTQFIEQVDREYAKENPCTELLDKLEKLFEELQKEALPQKREEFEVRALLYYVLRLMKELLELKQQFMKSSQHKD